MKKKILAFFFVIAAILFIIFVLRFVIGGSEDTWICVNGQWQKHGNPSSTPPSETCVK